MIGTSYGAIENQIQVLSKIVDGLGDAVVEHYGTWSPEYDTFKDEILTGLQEIESAFHDLRSTEEGLLNVVAPAIDQFKEPLIKSVKNVEKATGCTIWL
jgi:hypothetical protein